MSYGWRDFDEAIVEALAGANPEHVVKHPNGGMTCPLISHGEWLPWQGGSYQKGTVSHGSPAITFRVSPTYILIDRFANFITGQALIKGAISGDWGKAETHRLGYENSEDAVSFNVFRSLQEAGELKRVAQLVTGASLDEPDLYIWGRQIHVDGSTDEWPELQAVRRKVEPRHRQQTEPDICLHVPDWGWIFIEAKLGYGIKVSPSAEKMKSWLALYPQHASTLFDLQQISEVEPAEFPEQLLRNIVFADLIRDEREQAHVVALGRAGDPTPIEDWLNACVATDCSVGTSQMSWEQIYRALPETDELAPLRSYFEDKSYSLRQAFSLGR